MSTFYTQLFVLGLFLISCEAKNLFANFFKHTTKWAKGQWEKAGDVICEGTFQSRKLKEGRKKIGMVGAGLAGTAAGAAALAAAGPAAIGLAAVVSGTSTVQALNGFFGTKSDRTTYQFKKGTFENEERIFVTVEIEGKIQYGYLTDIIIERTNGIRAKEYTDKRYQAIFRMKSLTGNGRLCDRIVYYMDKAEQKLEESHFPKMLKKLHEVINGNVEGHVRYTVKNVYKSAYPTIQYNGAAQAPDFADFTAAVAGKKMSRVKQLERIEKLETQNSFAEYEHEHRVRGLQEARIMEEHKYDLKLKKLENKKNREISELETKILRLQQRITLKDRQLKQQNKILKRRK